ncbi:MAG: hypothetical protein NT126_01835 [Bacteroidetes bacterium]|nr:hypothetical protein [Bacteroidota bacterium]
MKKIIKRLIIAFILIGTSAAEVSAKVIVTIVLARHRDCEGFGWCRWTIEVPPLQFPFENIGRAEIDMDDERHIVLTMNADKDITPEAFKTYFSNGFFLCEDDFPLPAEILKEIGYEDDYTIKAGKYPISIKGETITITF